MLKSLLARRMAFLAIGSCLLLASSGCGAFSAPHTRQAEFSANSGGPSYTVEFHADKKRGWQRKFPMSGPMHVSAALEQARATNKLGEMNVSVIRNVKGTNRTVAMAVTKKGKGVSPNTNYAIHDGDRIVIKEDTSGPLDHLTGLLPTPY